MCQIILYSYHINLNERGSFYADVRDAADQTVFEIRAGNELGDDERDIFELGFMRNAYDMSGLTTYLHNLGVIPKDGMVVLECELDLWNDYIRRNEQ
ncbi:MAG: hypothetical protein FWF12_00275 [Betaproteobacteria bacterium]|nr:hypothetical protein [Betaproteobacteria bacterium]